MKAILPLSTDPKLYTRILEIGLSMSKTGLPPHFVDRVNNLALEFEGAYDLMELWSEEEDAVEKANIIADLEEHLDEGEDHPIDVSIRPKINFDDIEDIANNVQAFKSRLRSIVDANGGVPELSKKTGMSKPALYRFFTSPSIPRKTTLYKIAQALDLEEKDIAAEYSK